MARARVHEDGAARQKAYTARNALVRVTVRKALVETLDRIGREIDCSRSELVAAMLRFAAEHPQRGEIEHVVKVDARTGGPTARLDVALPEGVDRREVLPLLAFAIAARQWARFGLRY